MYEYQAVCTHVVDGDTMDFDVDLGFHLTAKIRVRLLDIDTPEIYGPDADKELGNKVKDFVEGLLENFNVTLRTKKTGSFGRWLATVELVPGVYLNERIKQEFPDIDMEYRR